MLLARVCACVLHCMCHWVMHFRGCFAGSMFLLWPCSLSCLLDVMVYTCLFGFFFEFIFEASFKPPVDTYVVTFLSVLASATQSSEKLDSSIVIYCSFSWQSKCKCNANRQPPVSSVCTLPAVQSSSFGFRQLCCCLPDRSITSYASCCPTKGCSTVSCILFPLLLCVAFL